MRAWRSTIFYGKRERIPNALKKWEENIQRFTKFRLPRRLIVDVIIIPVFN
jgi:hypothetical protein